jgi:hypothetical protein
MEIQDRVDEMPKHSSLVAKFADALAERSVEVAS